MKINNSFLLFLIVLLSSVTGCKKDDPKTYDSTPELSFVSISPNLVKEFQDSIIIVLSYKDGDGDLGENNPNVDNLFVKDKRINITYPFRVQQLSPDNSAIAIQGKLNVVLKNTGITNGSSQETLTYEIYMKDRAGNQSNTITTSSITVSN